MRRVTWFDLMLKIENENFINYIDFMEEIIDREEVLLKQECDNHLESCPDEEKEHVYEYLFEDRLYNVKTVFPKILRTSALISQYSYFEKTLNKISNDCKERYDLLISPEDIRHNGIKKYIFYLKNVVGLNLNDNQSLWQKIYAYNQLRNRFVHSSDEKYKKKEKLNFEQKVKGLIFEQYHWDPNIYELMFIEKEINTHFFELFTAALEIISAEIKIKNKDMETNQ